MRQSAAKFLRRPGSGHHDDKDGADWGFHFFSLGYLWIRCERTLASNRARLRKFAVTTHHKSSYIGWVTINGDPHINEDLHLYKESRLKRENRSPGLGSGAILPATSLVDPGMLARTSNGRQADRLWP